MATAPAPPRDEDRCVALTRAGRRCLTPRLPDSPFCRVHTGRVAEQARARAQCLRELGAEHPPSSP